MRVPVRKFLGGGQFDIDSTSGQFQQQLQDRDAFRAKGEAVWDGFGNIPVVGGIFKAFKGFGDLVTKPDEYGYTKKNYRDNPELKNQVQSFELDQQGQAINNIDVAGANRAFNTPTFKAPAFGRFGMKFNRFR